MLDHSSLWSASFCVGYESALVTEHSYRETSQQPHRDIKLGCLEWYCDDGTVNQWFSTGVLEASSKRRAVCN